MQARAIHKQRYLMFRNSLIISLSLAAIALAIPGGIGMFQPLFASWSPSNRCHGYVYFKDGIVRVYAYRCNKDVYYKTTVDARLIKFFRSEDDKIFQRITHAKPDSIPPYALVSTAFTPPRDMPNTLLRLTGVRSHVKLPVALLIAYPVIAVGGDRLRRRRVKPGHCRTCGYDLTGNISGICPECGEHLANGATHPASKDTEQPNAPSGRI